MFSENYPKNTLMKSKRYNSFEEIATDLRRLDLERQIQLEELKLTRHELKEDLRAPHWLGTLWVVAQKFGLMILLKKILR